MKTNCITLATVFYTALTALATEPLSWVRKPNQPAPAQFDTFHGESLDFRCTFTGFGALPFAGDDAPRLYYQTNGMGAAWWSLPATVSSNMLSATFPPSADPGAERLSVFFGAPSNAYAAAQVRFRNSPGATPNHLDPPFVLDWQAELAAAMNAVYTKAEADARIAELAPRTSLEPATNYADEVTGALSNALVTGAMQVWNAWGSQDSQHANYADVAGALSDGTSQRSGAQIFAHLDAASHITTNDVCSIVTNETEGAFGEWVWSCSSQTTIWGGRPDSMEDTGYRYAGEEMPLLYEDGRWIVQFVIWSYDPFYDEFDPWGPDWRDFEIPGDGSEVKLTFDCDYYGLIIATRTHTPGQNALGLARPSDITNTVTKAYVEGLGIESGVSAATATNIAESVVNAMVTGVVRAVSFKVKDYIFDPVTEVCWRRQMVDGFLDYIAVTNIDVTLPENYEALEALERRDNQ